MFEENKNIFTGDFKRNLHNFLSIDADKGITVINLWDELKAG